VSFTPEGLRAVLERTLQGVAWPPEGYCVALSGGLDSTVLLDALAGLRDSGAPGGLRAIHVDHGLHPDSPRWSESCARLAARLRVECTIVRVDAGAEPGESPEAAARMARYRALAERLRAGEVLLTAHHGDDQLEGVLLQWLRGGGLRAIAGMRPLSAFAAGWHARPLLGFTRGQLQSWAEEQPLDWLEDPSNLDARFDRNYLRLEVLPAIRRRWPAAARTVGRVAAQAAEMLELDDEAAIVDLAALVEGETVAMARLRGFDPARQKRALRAWLRTRGLAVPAAATLEALWRDMQVAAADRVPESRWPGGVVRRYRDRLYADASERSEAPWGAGAWAPGADFQLGSLGRLELRAARGVGFSRPRLHGSLTVIPRPAGAQFRPAGAAHRRPLRKWLQERGVLPWWRDRLPVVSADGEVVAIGDLAYGDTLAAGPEEDSWRIVWHGRPALTEDEATHPSPADLPMREVPRWPRGD
jgi:tRNA(Ile)-lysidine synthase